MLQDQCSLKISHLSLVEAGSEGGGAEDVLSLVEALEGASEGGGRLRESTHSVEVLVSRCLADAEALKSARIRKVRSRETHSSEASGASPLEADVEALESAEFEEDGSEGHLVVEDVSVSVEAVVHAVEPETVTVSVSEQAVEASEVASEVSTEVAVDVSVAGKLREGRLEGSRSGDSEGRTASTNHDSGARLADELVFSGGGSLGLLVSRGPDEIFRLSYGLSLSLALGFPLGLSLNVSRSERVAVVVSGGSDLHTGRSSSRSTLDLP